MKSTSVRGVKEYLKPYAYKQWKGVCDRLRLVVLPDRVPFA